MLSGKYSVIKRILDFSEQAYIHLKHNQLLIDRNNETIGCIPVEDIGMLILQHPAIVITQAVIIACQNNNVGIIFCDDKHLPYSLILPISEGNNLHNKILGTQIEIKLATKKRLWQQIVKEKIIQQSITLKLLNKNTVQIDQLLRKVKSGDKENTEAQAAQKYWRLLLGNNFRRDQNAGGINALLNYGYSIIRAMIARAIVGSGLHPALGLHHKNQYNGLCLADDLMEPFRPWVDMLVYQIINNDERATIDINTKKILLGLISDPVIWEGKTMPLMVACHYMMANLKRAYIDSSINIIYPKLETRLVK